MSKKLPLIILICVLSLAGMHESAAASAINVTLKKQPPKREYKDRPPKGTRMPSAPDHCSIDIAACLFESTIEDEIYSYEVWDSDGEYAIAVFTDDTSLAGYLSELSGVYQIRLVTECYEYIGFIEL